MAFQSDDEVQFLLPFQHVPTEPAASQWPVRLCVAHGGLLDGECPVSNPSERHYWNDQWSQLSYDSCVLNKIRAVWYTSRGYGNSSGWQEHAETHANQFGWHMMGQDLSELMNQCAPRGYIAMGNSNGAAAALYAAFPQQTARSGKLDGLILLRLPGAYNSAEPRRTKLQQDIDALPEDALGAQNAAVIRGSAVSCPVSRISFNGT